MEETVSTHPFLVSGTVLNFLKLFYKSRVPHFSSSASSYHRTSKSCHILFSSPTNQETNIENNAIKLRKTAVNDSFGELYFKAHLNIRNARHINILIFSV